MNEEMDEIKKTKTRELVPIPINKSVIDTKWVLRNSKSSNGCQICFPQWRATRGSLHRVARRFSANREINYVFILKKALCGLNKSPRAWYSKLDIYLPKCGFKRGAVDNKLYVKEKERKLIVGVVYIDDIIFVCDSCLLTNEFTIDMKVEYEISMLGYLSYFLGL